MDGSGDEVAETLNKRVGEILALRRPDQGLRPCNRQMKSVVNRGAAHDERLDPGGLNGCEPYAGEDVTGIDGTQVCEQVRQVEDRTTWPAHLVEEVTDVLGRPRPPDQAPSQVFAEGRLERAARDHTS